MTALPEQWIVYRHVTSTARLPTFPTREVEWTDLYRFDPASLSTDYGTVHAMVGDGTGAVAVVHIDADGRSTINRLDGNGYVTP